MWILIMSARFTTVIHLLAMMVPLTIFQVLCRHSFHCIEKTLQSEVQVQQQEISCDMCGGPFTYSVSVGRGVFGKCWQWGLEGQTNTIDCWRRGGGGLGNSCFLGWQDMWTARLRQCNDHQMHFPRAALTLPVAFIVVSGGQSKMWKNFTSQSFGLPFAPKI